VVVAEDQLSLAIGKRGQNVRLAARLTGWDIDILTPAEYNKGLDNLEKTLKGIGVADLQLDKMLAMGIVSLMDVEEVGAEPLVSELEVDAELADSIVSTAAEEARRLAAEAAAAKTAAEEEAARQGATTDEDGATAEEPQEDSVEEAAGESAEGETAESATADTAEPAGVLAVSEGQPDTAADEAPPDTPESEAEPEEGAAPSAAEGESDSQTV
jgi:N utilization substance protein A